MNYFINCISMKLIIVIDISVPWPLLLMGSTAATPLPWPPLIFGGCGLMTSPLNVDIVIVMMLLGGIVVVLLKENMQLFKTLRTRYINIIIITFLPPRPPLLV